MSTAQRVSRGFHWIGFFLSAIVMMIGLASIISDLEHLGLWDVPSKQASKAVAEVLLSMLGLAVACLLVYGVVRAIGWVVGGFTAT